MSNLFLPQPSRGTPEEREAAAQHWEALAAQEEARLAWDRHAHPRIVASRTALWRQVARDLRAP